MLYFRRHAGTIVADGNHQCRIRLRHMARPRQAADAGRETDQSIRLLSPANRLHGIDSEIEQDVRQLLPIMRHRGGIRRQ